MFVMGALGLAMGVGLGVPELVVVAAPLLLLVVIGHLTNEQGIASVTVEVAPDRVLEDDTSTIRLAFEATRPARDVEVRLDLPAGAVLEGVRLGDVSVDPHEVLVVDLPEGSTTLTARVSFPGWGTYLLGGGSVGRRSLIGHHAYGLELTDRTVVKSFPHPAALRTILEPVETRLGFGELVSRAKGPGLEYADLRQWAPGDDRRTINWRVTARAGDPWVTQRHPERNADIVLLIDTFAEARRSIDATIDLAVRAASALIDAHGGRLDRIGLMAFGGPVRWIRPGMGDRHRYRLLELLMESRIDWQHHWRGLSAAPSHTLPANALVVGLTPLLDERMVAALADVRARGFDLVIVELEPTGFLPDPIDDDGRLARRIWDLERDHVRRRFSEQGVIVTDWHPGEPLDLPLVRAQHLRARLRGART
jgi:hypothetical protein